MQGMCRAFFPAFILFLLLACQLVGLPGAGVPTQTVSPPGASPNRPTAAWTAPAASPSPSPSEGTPTPAPREALASLVPGASSAFTLRYHPDGGLFVGDVISLEVIPPANLDLEGREIAVAAGGAEGADLGVAKFAPFGLGGRLQATFYWSWDTRGLQPGQHTLTFTLLPEGPQWTESLTLQPRSALQPPEPLARWASVQSECCQVYYVTQTAAQRDLELLLEMADEQAELASQALQSTWDIQVPVVLVPRVMGHGGFTTQEVAISYLDRDYTGGSADIILRHEMLHLLDGQLGGEYRPSLFIEGLAVHLSGGHFKPEDPVARAAALLEMGWYLPLHSLTQDFYHAQHEVSYIEAGALVGYMVERWGWPAFNAFYRSIRSPAEGEDPLIAIDQALATHFQLSLAQLEEDFLAHLRSLEISPGELEEVRQSVAFYDALRRYQQALDPSAYFLTAWMLDGEEMRSRGIVADYLRHPSVVENQALETLLISAATGLRQGEYVRAGEALAAVNAVLEAIERDDASPFAANALAADYYAVVGAVAAQGYQVQRIQLSGDQATAWVSGATPLLSEVHLQRAGGSGWMVSAGL